MHWFLSVAYSFREEIPIKIIFIDQKGLNMMHPKDSFPICEVDGH